MRLNELAEGVGKGLFAGAVGTAAMTVSSTIEMNLRQRQASTVPARAAEKVLGVEPNGEAEQDRFSNLTHWGYGTGWGALRGVIAAAGYKGPKAAALHYGAVYGTELVMLPSLDIGVPPAYEWGAKEVAIDAFHHLVYAAATSVAYELLDR
jgi:hypothetical protein